MPDPLNLDSLHPDAGPPPPEFLRAVRNVRVRRRLIRGAMASAAALIALVAGVAFLREPATTDSSRTPLAAQPTNTYGHLRSALTTPASIDILPVVAPSEPPDAPSPLLIRDLQRFEDWFTSE